MLIWLFGVNLLYSFLLWLLFPSFIYLWLSPLVISLILVFLSLDLEGKTSISIVFRYVQQYAITFLWFFILVGLGILLYSLGFGIYSLIVLLVLNISLFFVSFLINYKEGKLAFFRGMIVSLMSLGIIWLKVGGGILAFLVLSFALIVGVLSFLYFVLRNWIEVEEVYKWYLITYFVVLCFWYVLFLREREMGSLIFVNLALQAYILVILSAFWIFHKRFCIKVTKGKKILKPSLEEVIKIEGVSPFFINKKELYIQKNYKIIKNLYELLTNLPEWIKTLIGIANFIAFGTILTVQTYLLIKKPLSATIWPYLLSLILFLINTLLLFILGFYRWRYRFLLAFLLNAMGYVIIYYFLYFDNVLLSIGLVAWSFVVLGFYRFLWLKRYDWNIFREDIWIGTIFNTFFVIVNVIFIVLIDTFPILQKVGLILTYIGIYGLWVYYLGKISFSEEEVVLSSNEDDI